MQPMFLAQETQAIGEFDPETTRAFHDNLSAQVLRLTDNSLAGAVLLIVAAIIVGVLIDKLLRATLNVWVGKSDTPLDDLALQHLSGPIVKTTVLYGFWAAAVHLNFEDGSGRLLVLRVIQTLLVMIWSFGVLGLFLDIGSLAVADRWDMKCIQDLFKELFMSLVI